MKLADEATAPEAMTRLMNSRRDWRRASDSTASVVVTTLMPFRSAMLYPVGRAEIALLPR
jgi:hypothetical protein